MQALLRVSRGSLPMTGLDLSAMLHPRVSRFAGDGRREQ